MEKQKNIIIFVGSLATGVVAGIRRYEKESGKQYRLLLLWDSRLKKTEATDRSDILVEVDFSKPHRISAGLLPYQDELLAITCRGDQNMARFAKVIPHVPYLRTPTTESLAWSTDKYEMRKRFMLHDPKSTPIFTHIKNNTKSERTRVIEKVKFPMVVKPANLGASLLVTICYHEEELEKALGVVFRKIKKMYDGDNRMEEPKVIAEEYMEGDMYSVDSYIDARGNITHCPMVRVTTGKDIGHDDFYNYTQTTPTVLKKETIEKAEAMAETAARALGLRSVTTHTELMKIDDEWKIIEVGPRPGGFRDTLHMLSCDIDHIMNDIAVRIPRKPTVPKKCKGFATAMKWFAEKEGKIIEMKGVKKIESLESFHRIAVNKKIGDRAIFCRNGGRSVFNVFLYNKDRSKLLADIRRIEQMVDIKVANGNGDSKKVMVKKVVTKKSPVVKKAASKKVVSKKAPAKKVVKKK